MNEEFTKYEVARIIGARALQLAMGAPILLKLDKEELEKLNYDVIKIAEKEFQAGVLPITVRRPLPKKREEKLVAEKEETEEEEKKKIELEERETQEIAEEGEIMELAKPEDETEEETTESEEEGIEI